MSSKTEAVEILAKLHRSWPSWAMPSRGQPSPTGPCGPPSYLSKNQKQESFPGVFSFLNKLVLTSTAQCSDACLVFGSADTRTPARTGSDAGGSRAGESRGSRSFLLHSIREKEERESCWKENRAQILSVWAACGPGSPPGEPARQLRPGAVGPTCVGLLWDLWDHATFSSAVATR